MAEIASCELFLEQGVQGGQVLASGLGTSYGSILQTASPASTWSLHVCSAGHRSSPYLLPPGEQGSSKARTLALGSCNLFNVPHAAVLAEARVLCPTDEGNRATGARLRRNWCWKEMGTNRNARLGLLRAVAAEPLNQNSSCHASWLINKLIELHQYGLWIPFLGD